MVDVPAGFRFAGVAAGIKVDVTKPDLALIVSDRPASAVGMFTTNRVCAAPVQVCRRRLPSKAIRGIVINSGNANACTGQAGLENAEAMTATLAEQLDVDPTSILVCSTGVIGRPLPMPIVPAGIKSAYAQLKSDHKAVDATAHAIMTTDTRPKVFSKKIETNEGAFTILGIAKGAAMIGPNMATMLAFVVTDALAEPRLLDDCIRHAVDRSFHCISVDGHTSTNDTVLLLANGASGVRVDEATLRQAVTEACQHLSTEIIRDAEGATKFVSIEVRGTKTDDDARKIAKAVADSPLVKSALFGNDPNWGRICSAAGYAGVPFEEHELSLTVNGSCLYKNGTPTAFDEAAESQRLKASREVEIELDFTLGNGKMRFWTSDLSYDYVRLNADYTT